MAFAFRLEKVLGIRRREEDEAARVHAVARERLDRARDWLSDLESNMRLTLALLDEDKKANRVDAEVLHYHSLHCAGLESDMELAEREICAANEAVRIAALALTEAHKAVEMLEKLRERDEEEWRKAELRRETLAMDEVAVMRHRSKEA